MELITNIIVEYLKHNKRLCVPKLGTFIVKQTSGEIKFSDLMRNDDGVLCSLLLAYGVKELEAKGMMDRFVFEVHHAVAIDGKFAIASLGEFTADLNNTITFKQAQSLVAEPQEPQPKRQGGRVKPPVEEFEQLKSKHERLHPRPESDIKHSKPKPQRKSAVRNSEEEVDIKSLGKPEAYLRGLKYDSNKNKKREEGGRSSRGYSGGGKWIVLSLMVVAVGAVLAVIFWPEQKPTTKATVITTPIIEEHDSLLSDTIPQIDSMLVDGVTPQTNITNESNPR